MRLVSFKNPGNATHLGALLGEAVIAFQIAARRVGLPDQPFSSMLSFLSAGDAARTHARKLLESPPQESRFSLGQIRLLPPVPNPGKIVAVGLNYRDHSMESGASEPPKVPILFAKFPNSIVGPDENVVIPAADPKVDYEAELAVVMGRRCKGVSRKNAFEYIAGYMPLNDVSARAWQFGDKQWVRGKSCDTFCPIGPYLTTNDEIPDPHSLFIRARVNGTTLQDSNTSKMIFHIPELIEFITESITLEPGDIIATGTPEGVGVFRKPPIYLQAGDVVEIEIEKLGVLRNPVVGPSSL